ncbi:MAG: hypothetical protein GX558_05210 [Clostridiales bacterium]|nr:hypothetical protein [Clostridiales bacterium]
MDGLYSTLSSGLNEQVRYCAGNGGLLLEALPTGGLFRLAAPPRPDGSGLVALGAMPGADAPAAWFEVQPEGAPCARLWRPDVRSHLADQLLPTCSVGQSGLSLTGQLLAPIGAPIPACALYQLRVASDRATAAQVRLRVRALLCDVAGPGQPPRPLDARWRVDGDAARLESPEGGLSIALPGLTPSVESGGVTFSGRFDLSAAQPLSLCACLRFDGTQPFDYESERARLLERAEALAGHLVARDLPAAALYRRAVFESLLCLRFSADGRLTCVVERAEVLAPPARLSDALWAGLPAFCLSEPLAVRLVEYLEQRQPAADPNDWVELDTGSFLAPLVARALYALAYRDEEPAAEYLNAVRTLIALTGGERALVPAGRMHGYRPLAPYALPINAMAAFALRGAARRLSGRDEPLAQEAGAAGLALARRAAAHFDLSRPNGGGRVFGGLKFLAPYRLDTLVYHEHDALDLLLLPLMGWCVARDPQYENTFRHLFSPMYALTGCRAETPVWWERGDRREMRQKHSRPHPMLALVGLDDQLSARLAVERMMRQPCQLRDGRAWGGLFLLLVQHLIGVQPEDGAMRVRPCPALRYLLYEANFLGRALRVELSQGQLHTRLAARAEPALPIGAELYAYHRHRPVAASVNGRAVVPQPAPGNRWALPPARSGGLFSIDLERAQPQANAPVRFPDEL